MTWRPLSKRGKPDPRFDEPHEGVPEWLVDSLIQWLTGYFPNVSEELLFRPDPGAITAWQRRLKTRVDDFDDLLRRCADEAELFLDTCDWLLDHLGVSNAAHDAARDLNLILDEAGSVWTVVGDYQHALERRVAQGARESLEQALTVHDVAGRHLRDAWTHAFGRHPNPDHAYNEAVKAVEVVARTVVSPKNHKATLGTVSRDMKSKPEKWLFSIAMRDGANTDAVPRVIGMLELLWRGNKRHGTDDGRPTHHGIEEAQAAVVLAATLVHWFGGGHVTATTRGDR